MKLSGGPTQDEVMAISLFKSGLRAGDVFADVGCGTGKVAIAASRIAERVYALDKRGEAIACARAAAENSGVSNIEFIEGDARDLLDGVGDLDCAFVGGTKGLAGVLEALSRKVAGNIVVNAVKIETVHDAIVAMKKLGIFREAVSVQICRSYDIAGGTMFKPIDPVYIIVGGKP